MRFTGDERVAIRALFKTEIIEPVQLKNLVNSEIIDLLTRENKFRSVKDRITFYDSNPYRPYDSVIIVKVLTENFDLAQSISRLIDRLTLPYLFFLDFNFILESTVENSTKYHSNFKVQLGSKSSAYNTHFKIVTPKDAENLKKEFQAKTYWDFLSEAFIHHSRMFELSSSGLCPFQLISVLLNVQRFP